MGNPVDQKYTGARGPRTRSRAVSDFFERQTPESAKKSAIVGKYFSA